MRNFDALHPGWGIALVRWVAGVILVVAGAQKFAGGIEGTVRFFASLGLPAPELLAPAIASLELLGGLLLLVGLGARWVALLFIGEFLVTTTYVKLPRQGWDAGRIDMMLLAAAVTLFLVGPGKASLDNWLAHRTERPAVMQRAHS